MYQATHRYVHDVDIAIFSAAVSDFKPKVISAEKIKKTADSMTLELVRTQDILASVGAIKKEGQFVVGFALETENEFENARAKLSAKNLDMIVLNSLRDKGAGFKSDTNKISILVSDGQVIDFNLKRKEEVAEDIFNEIIKYIHV
jgi:phosphopantothenoylcysteine decarboxylase/phosphopantothenate--cysteine ligase